MHIGQTITAALEFVGQTFVVDAQEMKQRGMQIMDMDRVLGDVVTEVVRLSK